MPTPPISAAEIARRKAAVEQCLREGYSPLGVSGGKGSAVEEASRRLSIGSSASLTKLISRGLLIVDNSLYMPPEVAAAEAARAESRQLQRLKDENAGLRSSVKALTRELNEAEDLRQRAFGLASSPIEPPAWTFTPAAEKVTTTIPVLFTSDFQWGEVVRPEEVDHLNEYNMRIASKRYQRLIERTIDISSQHMGKIKCPGIIYLRGGDSISGLIHEELRETNDLQAVPAVRDLCRHEVEGIRQLKSHFGRVHVISVPGNHGRTQMQKQSKGATINNFDTLLSWWIESYFAASGDTSVTFYTPASGDAYFPVYDYPCLLTHGDRMGSRGGQGFIGPAATITRGMKKTYDSCSRTGRPIVWIFCGHYHTSLKLTYGFANGSLAGYTEYARDIRADPSPPSQWLLFFHPRYGVTAQWDILLEDRPRASVTAAAPSWQRGSE